MPPYCELCGTKLVPVEENAYACPSCGQGMNETPHTCDYCHEHVASMPSENGTWICDNCIMQAIVGPAVFEEILATQAHLTRTSGQPVSLGEAFTAWRKMTESTKISPTSPAKGVKTDAS